MYRVFEYKLRPTKEQVRLLNIALDETRKLYNQALEEWKKHYEETGECLREYAQKVRYNKKTHPLVHSSMIGQTIKRLHDSMKKFFRRRKKGDMKYGFPRFKGPERWHSLVYGEPDNTLNQKKKVFGAGKICGGRIKVILHRPAEGKHKMSRIIKRPSGWYLQYITEAEPRIQPKTGQQVGLDFGCIALVADSNGDIIENPRYHKKSLAKLVAAQQKMAACQKGSNRRKKAKAVYARMHERVSSQRQDTLHKVARRYIQKADLIVIENLEPKRMTHDHRSLSFSIMDCGWAQMRHYLEYKAEDAGRQIIVVNPARTSRTCSGCERDVPKELDNRIHECPHCGLKIDRDVNAARNILRAGTQPSDDREAHASRCGSRHRRLLAFSEKDRLPKQ